MSTVANEVTGDVTYDETVTFPNGQSRVFVGNPANRGRQLLKESFYDSGVWTHTNFYFRNGQLHTVLRKDLKDEIIEDLIAHGVEQKVGDAAAGEKDVGDMYLAVESVADRLREGEWAAKREGGGFSGTSVLLEALVRAYGRTVDQAKAFLKTKTPEQKLAMRRDARLKSVVEQIESERAAKSTKKIDTDSLFGELEQAAS